MKPFERLARGFSLIEMLVVTALVLTALLLAAGLFQEAGRILKGAEGELAKPLTGLTVDRLRQDLQASSGLLLPTSGWSSGPLFLRRGDDTVIYAQDGGELVRGVLDEDGEIRGREAWIRTLLSWRWQVTGWNLVEVEIVYGTPADLSRWRLDEAPTRPAPGVKRESLLLTLRGRGKASGW